MGPRNLPPHIDHQERTIRHRKIKRNSSVNIRWKKDKIT